MIDTKRLATDAGYWRECGAPEDATHAMPKRGYGAAGVTWFKRTSKCDWKVWSRYEAQSFLRWCDSAGTSDGRQFIPRPQSEWVDGLPPLGRKCEYRPDPSMRPGWWEPCVYLANHDGEHFVLMTDNNGVDRVSDETPAGERFRPIPTKAQRDRGELEAAVVKALRQCHCSERDKDASERVADAIIAAGWTKP